MYFTKIVIVICGMIRRNLRNKTRHSRNIKFYKKIEILTLIYASEAWVMTKMESGKIQSAEMQFLRNTLNYPLQDRICLLYTSRCV